MMLYNPFEKSPRSSCIRQLPTTSVLHSRAITELECKKPLYLINENSCYRPAGGYMQSGRKVNPFGNTTAQVSGYRVEGKSIVQRKFINNPFVTTTPYRHQQVDLTNSSLNGLASWERTKYLSELAGGRYSPRQNWKPIVDSSSREKDSPFLGNDNLFMQRGGNGMDKMFKADRGRLEDDKLNKAQRIEQILSQFNDQKPRKRSQGVVSFSVNDIRANKVTDSGQFSNLKHKFSSFQKQKNQGSQSSSLINKLASITDHKAANEFETIRMTDSKVYEYKLGLDLRGQNDDDRQFNFDAGRFKEFRDDKQKLDETSKFNSYKRPEYPESITYRNTVYGMIRV